MLAKHGDRVFLNLDYLHIFLLQFSMWGAGAIRKKFVLVCQNSDRQFNEQRLQKLAPYALHIYSINCVIQHPMVTAIPIGFGDWSLDILPAHDKTPLERTIELYGAFTIGTNAQIRQPCYDAIKQDPRVVFQTTDTRQAFYDLIRKSKYVICPEGEGHDTHRIYESIYFGAVPVLVRGNPLTHMYDRLEFPIKWVDSWSDMVLDWESDKKRLDEWVAANPDWASRSIF